MNLTDKKCVPCEGGTPPLTESQVKEFRAELKNPWSILDNKKIQREFKFKDFASAMTFVNQVAAIAEGEGHHPDIHVYYNRVVIDLWTHAVHGLSENDFIVAAKIDALS